MSEPPKQETVQTNQLANGWVCEYAFEPV